MARRSAQKSRRQRDQKPSKPRRKYARSPNGIAASADFLVVGLGASAGGFESLTAFFQNLPEGTGMSFAVVQHLDPLHPSKLSELLGRGTPLKVLEIENGQALQANCVHVLPPDFGLTIEKQKFRLQARSRKAATRMPIDTFFDSLAADLGPRAVGVVLSGMGNDGAEGLAAIKRNGGLAFAESRESARFFSMPQSAIATGWVDEVVTPAALARKLVRIARNPLLLKEHQRAEVLANDAATGGALEQIFRVLNAAMGVNFARYKENTLLRRIARRLVLKRVESLDLYADLLKSDPAETEALFNDLLINVTGFFRDKEVYDALKKTILPELIKGKPAGSELRIWVPGCASGEEVYSLAICIDEVIGKLKVALNVHIFGTDLSEAAIAKARVGIYPSSISRDVSPERLRRCFTKAKDSYRIAPSLREMCTFARQNLIEDPPFSRVDLISCRNLLIYLDQTLQRKCLPIFYYALNPEGYLVLGTSETVGPFADLFALVEKRRKIYRKKTTPGSPTLQMKKTRLFDPVKPKQARHHADAPGDDREILPNPQFNSEIQRAADQLILTHFAPCGVVIDTRMQVWHFRGYTAPYLEHAPGIASLNLLKLVRHDLAPDVSAVVHQAIKEGAGVRKEPISYREGRATRHVSIEVVPFSMPPSKEQWLLVMFEPAAAVALPELDLRKGRRSGPERAYLKEIERLRAELSSTKGSLQAIIEEQEATNEELTSASEEIESSNEELQSTNEELETAKEELQSTNEELTTVNDELNSRNAEVTDVNNDLHNLLSSINIPIIMVDNALTIRRATPLAEKVFNIIPGDIGRPLSDINPSLDVGGLTAMIREVIDQLAPREREVRDKKGHRYSLRIRPYRTRDNIIDGAVLTLVDIHDVKAAGNGGAAAAQRRTKRK